MKTNKIELMTIQQKNLFIHIMKLILKMLLIYLI